MNVKVQNKSEFPLPQYATEGSVGFDLRASFPDKGGKVLGPGEMTQIGAGLYFQIPAGYELQIRARSGLSFRNGISLVNGIGTIDQDYRGEVRICLVNLGSRECRIEHGDRIAQGVVSPILRVFLEETDSLQNTDRGNGGFGSTGVR